MTKIPPPGAWGGGKLIQISSENASIFGCDFAWLVLVGGGIFFNVFGMFLSHNFYRITTI